MIQSARRIKNYHYAIRQVARAADQLASSGRKIVYLNIGDPQVYGFVTDHVLAGAGGSPVHRCSQSAGLLKHEKQSRSMRPTWGRHWTRRYHRSPLAPEAADILLTTLLDREDQVLVPVRISDYPVILSDRNCRLAITRRRQKAGSCR
jgi:hypothetical protein